MKDLYEILGVNKAATDDEIKRAYRKLAQKHHPDRNKGDKSSEEKFKEINAAYETLSDKQKRQNYDQFGNASFGGGAGQSGFQGGFDFSNLSGFGENFADIFETFFGGNAAGRGRKSSQAATPGDDREIAISISFEEAAFGVEKEVKISRVGECETCKGSGAAHGSKIITCPACNGSGEIRSVRATIIGQVTTRRVCDACSGAGKVPEKECGNCHGHGRMRITDRLKIRVPAGIEDGSTIRIVGKGDVGFRSAESGDLYVHIQVLHHKLFTRKGSDVYSQQNIHLVQAVLGDTVNIQTIHGPIKMTIPAGTASGKVFKLKEYGAAKLKSDGKGDHFVTINIAIPEKLTRRERELFQQLALESGLKLHEEKGFFKKIIGE